MTFNSWHVSGHYYFITATVIGWVPLFSTDPYAEIALNSLAWLRNEKRIALYAFVLMPSHLHGILQPLDREINEILQNLASFTAHAILHQLQMDKNEKLLAFFHENRRDLSKEHSIWQDVQAKNIFSDKYLAQKMEYIHQNPVSGKYPLVRDRVDYKYSSACYYDAGTEPIIEIDDIRAELS